MTFMEKLSFNFCGCLRMRKVTSVSMFLIIIKFTRICSDDSSRLSDLLFSFLYGNLQKQKQNQIH